MHNLGEYLSYCLSCSKEDLEQWILNEDTVNNFNGFVEMNTSDLDNPVPNDFPNNQTHQTEEVTETYNIEIIDDETGEVTIEPATRLITQFMYDEDGEPITRNKTYREFCGGNLRPSLNEGKTIVSLGSRDNKGNINYKIKSDELYTYINHFGINNIKTKEEIKLLTAEQNDN